MIDINQKGTSVDIYLSLGQKSNVAIVVPRCSLLL